MRTFALEEFRSAVVFADVIDAMREAVVVALVEDLRHGGPLPQQEKAVLVLEPLQAARGDVVLDARAGRVGLGVSRESLPHAARQIESQLPLVGLPISSKE